MRKVCIFNGGCANYSSIKSVMKSMKVHPNLELNWKSKYTLRDMIMDGWKWQKMNPTGYEH